MEQTNTLITFERVIVAKNKKKSKKLGLFAWEFNFWVFYQAAATYQSKASANHDVLSLEKSGTGMSLIY